MRKALGGRKRKNLKSVTAPQKCAFKKYPVLQDKLTFNEILDLGDAFKPSSSSSMFTGSHVVFLRLRKGKAIDIKQFIFLKISSR